MNSAVLTWANVVWRGRPIFRHFEQHAVQGFPTMTLALTLPSHNQYPVQPLRDAIVQRTLKKSTMKYLICSNISLRSIVADIELYKPHASISCLSDGRLPHQAVSTSCVSVSDRCNRLPSIASAQLNIQCLKRENAAWIYFTWVYQKRLPWSMYTASAKKMREIAAITFSGMSTSLMSQLPGTIISCERC